MPVSTLKGTGGPVGFKWKGLGQYNPFSGSERLDIEFKSVLRGTATGITIGGVPCGQLSLPIGYAQIIDSETNNVTTLAGSYYVSNGKRYFVEPYFPREDDTESVHGDGTFESEDEGIDAPPLNTLAIIGYAEESLLASMQAPPDHSYSADNFEGLIFTLARYLGNGTWEEIPTNRNDIYVQKVRLSGNDLTTTSDDITDDEMMLPDPERIPESLLLIIKYKETMNTSWNNGLEDHGRTTDATSFILELYYKGITTSTNNGSTYENLTWLLIKKWKYDDNSNDNSAVLNCYIINLGSFTQNNTTYENIGYASNIYNDFGTQSTLPTTASFSDWPFGQFLYLDLNIPLSAGDQDTVTICLNMYTDPPGSTIEVILPIYAGFEPSNGEIPIENLEPGMYQLQFYGENQLYLIGEHHEKTKWNDWNDLAPLEP